MAILWLLASIHEYMLAFVMFWQSHSWLYCCGIHDPQQLLLNTHFAKTLQFKVLISCGICDLQGELSFERLLRVDGSFKGTLTSTGDLVVGASGVIRGNISDLREVCSACRLQRGVNAMW